MEGVQTYRPRRMLVSSISGSLSLMAASVLGWTMLPAEIRAKFSDAQVATLALFVLVMVGVMLSLGLCLVRADDTGLFVRNGVRTHRVPWSEIVGIRFRQGDPWAYALLPDDERMLLMGIQRTDGESAQQAVAELRARLDSGPDASSTP